MSARKSCKFAVGELTPLDMDALVRFLREAFPTATALNTECAAGVPAATVENWLRGRSTASGAHLGALATAFGPAFLAAAFPGVRIALKRQVRHERIERLLEQLTGELSDLLAQA